MTKCPAGTVFNPATGKCVLATGTVGKKLLASGGTTEMTCEPGKMPNPRSASCVKKPKHPVAAKKTQAVIVDRNVSQQVANLFIQRALQSTSTLDNKRVATQLGHVTNRNHPNLRHVSRLARDEIRSRHATLRNAALAGNSQALSVFLKTNVPYSETYSPEELGYLMHDVIDTRQLAADKKVAVVKRLLDAGAPVNVLERHGGINKSTALMKAAFHGEADVVTLLLDRGADVNLQTDHGDTALYYAIVYSDDLRVVKILLERGANVHARNIYGETPLISVARGDGRVRQIKLLLDHGADINAQDTSGKTALIHAAAHGGTLGAVKALLDRGADVHIKDNRGLTALRVAYRRSRDKNTKMTSFLREHGARSMYD